MLLHMECTCFRLHGALHVALNNAFTLQSVLSNVNIVIFSFFGLLLYLRLSYRTKTKWLRNNSTIGFLFLTCFVGIFFFNV